MVARGHTRDPFELAATIFERRESPMIGRFIAWSRSRTREQWDLALVELWREVRIWIQENAEKAALVGFLAGVVAIVLLRLVVAVLLFLFLLYVVVWTVAESAAPARSKDPTPNDDSEI
jgi:hypothetical protein